MRTISELQLITDNFLHELQDSEQDKKTSLQFIRHTLSSAPLVQPGEIFQVIIIGGSFCKTVMLKKTDDGATLLSSSEKSLPAFSTEQSLLTFISAELDPNVSIVALNFAYPLTPVFADNRLDGILVSGSKEHSFSGLVGKRVCQTIEAYIKATTQRTVIFSCANDTICLLLSGITEKSPSDIAAGIVGTGLNFALFLDERTAINLEAGSFAGFPQSNEGKIIDKNSVAPQTALFEKEISGAYLFQHFNLRAKKMDLALQISSTEELDQLAKTDTSDVGKLAQDLLYESAQLTACAVSAMTRFKQTPLTFVMEGSLFWKGYCYKETVAETVKQLVPDYPVDFTDIPESYFLGPAKLVS